MPDVPGLFYPDNLRQWQWFSHEGEVGVTKVEVVVVE